MQKDCLWSRVSLSRKLQSRLSGWNQNLETVLKWMKKSTKVFLEFRVTSPSFAKQLICFSLQCTARAWTNPVNKSFSSQVRHSVCHFQSSLQKAYPHFVIWWSSPEHKKVGLRSTETKTPFPLTCQPCPLQVSIGCSDFPIIGKKKNLHPTPAQYGLMTSDECKSLCYSNT